MKPRNIILSICAFVALVAISVVIFQNTYCPESERTGCEYFDCKDKKLWQESHQKIDNPRQWLYPKLQKCLRIGMTRDEVRKITGIPKSSGINVDGYLIGVPTYGIDIGVYKLYFDDDDRLIEYRFIQG